MKMMGQGNEKLEIYENKWKYVEISGKKQKYMYSINGKVGTHFVSDYPLAYFMYYYRIQVYLYIYNTVTYK